MAETESRLGKSLLNARVNLLFYFLTLILSFISRKIFLEMLGAEFAGLSGTLQNILGYLNLAELGIGTAVAFNLYKPIQEHDRSKIIEIVSLMGYFYRKIGFFVIGAGTVIALFLPLIFKNSGFGIGLILFCYLSYLMSSLYSYFLNYRQIVIDADQRGYIVKAYYQSAQIVSTLLQMLVAYLWQSYYGVIIIQMLYGLFYCYILDRKLNKEYPWLKLEVGRGKEFLSKYPLILKSTKQVFVHKFKDFLLTQSDQIFVFAFVSLKMVAYYGNYTLLVTKLSQIVSAAMDGIASSVGNLVAENNKNNIKEVFWQLISLRYLVAGIFVYNLYVDIQPFILNWLGAEYQLSSEIVILMLVVFFIYETRGVVDMFNNAYGHYGDVWSAWVEGAINLTVTVIVGIKFGLIGILIGKLASILPIVVLWKPFYLFRDGFNLGYWGYWKNIMKLLSILGLSWTVVSCGMHFISLDPSSGWMNMLLYAILHFFAFAIVYVPLLLLLFKPARAAIVRIPIVKRVVGLF